MPFQWRDLFDLSGYLLAQILELPELGSSL